MNLKEFDTKESLLQNGKAAFLACGFERVSLRTICRNAGVTTGAFYTHFAKKEDLFSAIVEPVIKSLEDLQNGAIHRALADVKDNVQSETEMIEFLCAHRDEIRLLFDCAEGTKYAGFRENLVNRYLMQSAAQCFEHYAGHSVDPSVVRLFVRMKSAQYTELIYGDYTSDEIRQLIRQYAAFTEAGFIKLIEELK